MSFMPEDAVTSSASTQTTHPERYICVHGHFYQPPRENAWLETIEVQGSAAPFHDWNERITAECYAPNGASRITSDEGQITAIVNNYARMSYNFGPTLLSWLEVFAPRTYGSILAADSASTKHFNGHGSAMAQVYNHIIMPLASERDALTQIRWGIADFEHRYKRKPEGMWLAETAVSSTVLDLMAREGIKFTVLAPNQCARVRPVQAAELPTRAERGASAETASTWTETRDASVDPTRPYTVRLREGRSISVFFYDGPTSRAIAFEGLLNSGEVFGKRLLSSFREHTAKETVARAQLAHVATDGESYGHHHRHGEMALSYALQWIEDKGFARLTNYGEFLERFSPSWEAEVVENSSWSCFHGVERWRTDCGCNGGKPGWNQAWRAPLREALDFLRDRTAPLAEAMAKPLLRDLWAARDAYISVILDRSRSNISTFFAQHAIRLLTPEERVTMLELLEMQRHTQLMYTSCGWFFDELSGIETIQIIAYAGRVLQLAAKLFEAEGQALEASFLDILARAKSNVPEYGNGAEIYRKWVVTSQNGLEYIGAHYAIASMFHPYSVRNEIFCFDVERQSYDLLSSGRGRVGLGRVRLRSKLTEETKDVCFAVLHLGDQNLSAAVRLCSPAIAATWDEFQESARLATQRADFPTLVRLIDSFFGGTNYSITSLFADEQHRILRSLLNQTVAEVEESLMRIYEEHATLLHFLARTNVPAPSSLAVTAELAINASLRRALESEVYSAPEMARLLRRAEMDNVKLDLSILSYAADHRMKRAMITLKASVRKQIPSALLEALTIAESLRALPGPSNLWQAQNIWHELSDQMGTEHWKDEWIDSFRRLGAALKIDVNSFMPEPTLRDPTPEILGRR